MSDESVTDGLTRSFFLGHRHLKPGSSRQKWNMHRHYKSGKPDTPEKWRNYAASNTTRTPTGSIGVQKLRTGSKETFWPYRKNLLPLRQND